MFSNHIFKKITTTSLLCIQFLYASSINEQQLVTMPYTIKNTTFDTRLSIGSLTGEANEYVYLPKENHTTSQLIWDIDQLTMLGIGTSVNINTEVKINADFWFSIIKGEGKLQNFDWIYKDLDWSHRSIHDNTNVSDAYSFDINTEIKIPLDIDTTVAALIGYRQDNFKWEAYGGDFIYSDEGFRDLSGSFKDDLLGITYKQTWKSPYIGAKIDTNLENINFNAKIIYSPFVSGKSTDNHHLRDLVAVDTFSKNTMLAIDIGIQYQINDALNFKLNYMYQKYETVTGDTKWNEKGEVIYLDDYAGADLKTSMVFIGLSYKY